MKKIILLVFTLFITLNSFSQVPAYWKNGIAIGSFASDPSGVRQGQIYWNSTDLKFRQYNGTEWQDLLDFEPTLFYPVENTYVDNTEMFANQGEQTEKYFQYISSTDIYYEKLATSTGQISDYRELTANETINLNGKNNKPVLNNYADLSTMYLASNQRRQIEGYIYRVDSDNSFYEYLGTRNGDATDYIKLNSFDVFRKSDLTTPADSYTEPIYHNGVLFIGEGSNPGNYGISTSSILSRGDIGVQGIIKTQSVATPLTLQGNSGIILEVENNSIREVLKVNGGNSQDIDFENTGINSSRNFTLPISQSVRPNFSGIEVSSNVDYSTSATYNNDGDFTSFFSNPIINGIQNNYALRGIGKIKLSDYGSGNVTGTPTFNLAVDVNGNFIEQNLIASPNLQAVTDEGNVTTNNIDVASVNDLSLFAQTGVDIDNIGIGIDALNSNTGTDVVGIGTNALQNNTSNSVTAVGRSAGQSNSGGFSTLIGTFAGLNNTGNNLTAIGYSAGSDNTGFDNIFIGRLSGANSTSDNSVAIGISAGRYTIKDDGVFIGDNAGVRNKGLANINIGLKSGELSTNDNSVFVGYFSGRYETGLGNTIIGYNSNSTFKDDVANLKNVVNAATDVDTGLNRITITAHGFGATGSYVNLKYTTTGTTIGGLNSGLVYQFQIIDANTIEYVSNLSSAGTGTHTFTPQFVYDNVTVLGANAEPTKSNQVTLGDSNVTEVDTYGLYKTSNLNEVTNKGRFNNILSNNDNDIIFKIQYEYWNGSSFSVTDGIGIGENAINNNEGLGVIAIGTNSGEQNTGDQGIFIGSGAGRFNQSPNSIAIGNSALESVSHSLFTNVAVGPASLQNATGGQNTAIGKSSFNSGGFRNTGLGDGSGQGITGSDNIAIGYRALSNSNTISSVIGIGREAFSNTQSNPSNVIGIGRDVGEFSSTINSNIFGYQSGQQLIGNSIDLYGYQSGRLLNGNNNVGLGYRSLETLEGNNNTALGYNSHSVFIEDGANAKTIVTPTTDVDTALNRITISSHGFGSNGTYINLKYTFVGDGIGNISNNAIYRLLIVDSNTLEFVNNISITSTGLDTDTITFTPQLSISNSTSIGANSEIEKSNQVVLGDSNVTEVKTSGMYVSGGYTVATLPTGVTGARAYVTDSNVTASGNFGATVAGGGSNVVPVFFDGTNWIIA